MTLSDDQLLDFDASRLADYDPKRARRTLEEHGDVYRAQLVAAHWIDYWAKGVLGSGSNSPEWRAGFEYAMREIAAHLRQGDLVPEGTLYEQTWRGESARE